MLGLVVTELEGSLFEPEGKLQGLYLAKAEVAGYLFVQVKVGRNFVWPRWIWQGLYLEKWKDGTFPVWLRWRWQGFYFSQADVAGALFIQGGVGSGS